MAKGPLTRKRTYDGRQHDKSALLVAAILADPDKPWRVDKKKTSPYYPKTGTAGYYCFAPATVHYRGLREALERYGCVLRYHADIRAYSTATGADMKPWRPEADPVKLMLRVVAEFDAIDRDKILRDHDERHALK